jgi:hypothetical protein
MGGTPRRRRPCKRTAKGTHDVRTVFITLPRPGAAGPDRLDLAALAVDAAGLFHLQACEGLALADALGGELVPGPALVGGKPHRTGCAAVLRRPIL